MPALGHFQRCYFKCHLLWKTDTHTHTEHEAAWDWFWEVSSFQKTTKNSLTPLKLCLKPVYSCCSLMSIPSSSARGNAKYSSESVHGVPKPVPWHSYKAPTIQIPAKCIPALILSSTRKLFNDSAWKKNPKIYFFMRISIASKGLKFLTWKFLRKSLGTCPCKAFISDFFFWAQG